MPVQKITLTLAVSSSASWVSPGNSLVQDGAEATLTRTGANTDWYMVYTTNAASVLPAAGSIVGVEIAVTARASVTTSTPRIASGAGTTTTNPLQSLTTGAATYTFGGPTDPLGVSSAAGLANVCLNTRQTTTTSTVYYIDAVVVSVYVDVPPGNIQPLTLTINPTGYTNDYWASPANALTANNSYASAGPGSGSRTLAYDTNAASVIPANAVILGVVITVRGYATTIANVPRIGAQPSSNGIGGATTLQPVAATNTTYNYGAGDDPLGAVSRADLATLALRVQNTSGSTSTYYIDHATMTVFWDYPPAGNALFFGENF